MIIRRRSCHFNRNVAVMKQAKKEGGNEREVVLLPSLWLSLRRDGHGVALIKGIHNRILSDRLGERGGGRRCGVMMAAKNREERLDTAADLDIVGDSHFAVDIATVWGDSRVAKGDRL